MTTLPWDLRFELTTGGLVLETSYDPVEHRLQASLTNNGDEPFTPGRIELVAPLALMAVSGNAWIHGRSTADVTLIHSFGDDIDDEAFDDAYFRELPDGSLRYTSAEMLGLSIPARAMPALFIGSLRGDRFATELAIDLDEDEFELASLRVVVDLEATTIKPAERLELPPLWIGDGTDLPDLADRYAEAVAAEMSARIPSRVPTAWSLDGATEDALLEGLQQARARAVTPDYAFVPAGDESAGDWHNDRLPGSMAALASRIRDGGLTPGLTLAPFLLGESSSVLRDHPEMVLRTKDDATHLVTTPYGRCAILDSSHPVTESWLRNLVSTITGEWGYGALALDSLGFAAQPASEVAYHDPAFTAPQNLRHALEIIREAAGDDAFLLALDSHFAPAVGLVDAMAVAPVSRDAGSAPMESAALVLQRNYMHMRWWANYPGHLPVDIADDAQRRFHTAVVVLSGGMVVASPQASQEAQLLADLLMPPAGVAAVPFDPADAPTPSAWRADLGDGRSLVGVLNWSDEPAWVHVDEYLDPGELAFDVFGGQMLGKGDVRLDPYDATLWQVTAFERGPRVVGDTGHINYARLFQRPVSGRIQVGNELDRPRTLAIDARRRAFEIVLQPGEKRWFD